MCPISKLVILFVVLYWIHYLVIAPRREGFSAVEDSYDHLLQSLDQLKGEVEALKNQPTDACPERQQLANCDQAMQSALQTAQSYQADLQACETARDSAQGEKQKWESLFNELATQHIEQKGDLEQKLYNCESTVGGSDTSCQGIAEEKEALQKEFDDWKAQHTGQTPAGTHNTQVCTQELQACNADLTGANEALDIAYERIDQLDKQVKGIGINADSQQTNDHLAKISQLQMSVNTCEDEKQRINSDLQIALSRTQQIIQQTGYNPFAN